MSVDERARYGALSAYATAGDSGPTHLSEQPLVDEVLELVEHLLLLVMYALHPDCLALVSA